MNRVVAYSGWTGFRNIGDEAILLANKQLFPNIEFLESRHLQDFEVLVFGGGTILPHYINDTENWGKHLNIAIGAGARSKGFWNQKFTSFDMGYYLGRAGMDRVLDNNYFQYLSTPIEKLSNNVLTDDHFITDQDFEAVKNANLDFLGVRGPITSNILSDYAIDHEITGDTALALEPSSYSYQRQNRVAITLRDGRYQWDAAGEYHSTVVQFCKKYADEFEFIFLPFYPQDIRLNRQAAKAVPNASLRDYSTYIDVPGVLEEISRCDLVIGDKLHSNVLSACTHTPFIALEYRPKSRDFAESVGMEEYIIETKDMQLETLDKKANAALYTDKVQDNLTDNVEDMRSKLEEFSKTIRQRIVGSI